MKVAAFLIIRWDLASAGSARSEAVGGVGYSLCNACVWTCTPLQLGRRWVCEDSLASSGEAG